MKTTVTKWEFDGEGRITSETVTVTETNDYGNVYPSFTCTCGSSGGCPIHRYRQPYQWYCTTTTSPMVTINTARLS